MEHQLWKAIVALLATFDKPRKRRAADFTDHEGPAPLIALQTCCIHRSRKPEVEL